VCVCVEWPARQFAADSPVLCSFNVSKVFDKSATTANSFKQTEIIRNTIIAEYLDGRCVNRRVRGKRSF